MNDLVSVIVPIFNAERYLKRCIESLINQRHKNIEIILINDGSTDDSLKICEYYKNKDYRIKVINILNRGVSYARNLGIINAYGKYITFVDSDDYVSAEYIDKLLKDLLTNKVDIAITGTNDFIDGRIVKEVKKISYKANNKEALKLLMEEKYFTAVIWGKIYKKYLFDKIKFNEKTKIAEDMEIMYKLIDKATNGIYIDTNALLYNYEIRNDSTVHSKISISRLKELDILKEMIEFIAKNYPTLKKIAIQKYVLKNVELINLLTIEKSKDKATIKILKKNIRDNKKYLNSLNFKNKIKVFLSLYFRSIIILKKYKY